ncbi:MAG: calcium-binding EGF-like domain-containing protein [Myxococcota bacterium]|nr:calcium-binding EGF-like domain-containing protein [Myxococcota bacterium]
MQDDLVVCGCRDGYEGNLCELDVNECLVDNGGCGEAECLNLEGTFKCGGCDAGYAPDEAGVCVDIDECETLSSPCDPRTDCTNTPGSYECSYCPVGYQGDPKESCRDLDECLRQPCDELSNCTNLFGSYVCSACPAGYDGDGKSCTDIDECLFENGGCEVSLRTCINTPGSFKCGACPAGYLASGAFECDDVDECTLKMDNCDEFPDVVCHNLVGSFECVDATPDECKTSDDCKVGFDCLDTGTSLQCVNIDECDTGDDDCKVGFDCVDTEGSWLCTPQDDGGGDGGEGAPCLTVADCLPAHVCHPALDECVPCPVGFPGVCDNVCYDLETDETNCGYCGNVCPDGIECAGANCQTGEAG